MPFQKYQGPPIVVRCAPSSSRSDRKTLFAFPVLRSINTTKMKQVSDSDLKLNRAHTYGRLRISRASVVAWPAALIVIGGNASTQTC